MRTMTSFVATLFILCAISLGAQEERPDPKIPQGKNLDVPVGWKVRTDDPGRGAVISADKEEADIWFVNMTPGWHVTTGPPAIFYHPASTAEGDYDARAVIHLFDPKGGNEGWGLVFGGADLEGEAPTYSYFLLRNSGEFQVGTRRGGDRVDIVQDWTPQGSIVGYQKGESSVQNLIAVACRGETVDFSINGKRVSSHPRSALMTAGIVGLRLGQDVNIHVSDLAVAPLK